VFETAGRRSRRTSGRYLGAAHTDGIYSANNPALKLVTNASRSWTDNDKDFVVDCDLLMWRRKVRRQRVSVDTCAAPTGANRNFGNSIRPGADRSGNYPRLGRAALQLEFGVSVQHEVLPRVSVDVGYNRRWWGNFFVNVNGAGWCKRLPTYTVPIRAIQPARRRRDGGVLRGNHQRSATHAGSHDLMRRRRTSRRRGRRTGTDSTIRQRHDWRMG
jgi:hypothetical protein